MEEEALKHINELIKRIADGDEYALTELYTTVGGRMLSVAFSIVGDRASAEDVLQDSFLTIVKKAGKFRESKNGYGWACTIVRHTALNYIKARKRRRCDNIDDLCFVASDSSVEDETVASVTVKNALTKLDKMQRAAIYCKYYEDLTIRQIAARLKITKSSADRLVKDAEATLRKIIDGGG